MYNNPSAFSAETLALAKSALYSSTSDLSKNVTLATNLSQYDLQGPAKLLYPTITLLRNSIPRNSRLNPGAAVRWRQIAALVGSGFGSMGSVPEGGRAAVMGYSAADLVAPFVSLGEEDRATFEAINSGKGFEDVLALSTLVKLQMLMVKEESMMIGGNASVALGIPTTPTVASAGSGATLPAATYSVIVVALTRDGLANASIAAPLSVTPTKLITGADGATFTLNGGVSNKSVAASQAVTLGQTLSCSVPVVTGAVAYAWFTGVAGSEKLEAITNINSVTFSAPLAGTGIAATAITVDASQNAYGYDGLLSIGAKGTGAYYKSLATGTPGTGTFLTASGTGTINEIDQMLLSMYNNAKISPTVIYVSPSDLANVIKKVLTGTGGAPLLRLNQSAENGDNFSINVGGGVRTYFNPYSHDGGTQIAIKVHPFLPQGTLIAYAERLPTWYQQNGVQAPLQIELRQEYYAIEWPLRTRAREMGVYCEGTLVPYAPFGVGMITNFGNG
jgi:hypothetical protein